MSKYRCIGELISTAGQMHVPVASDDTRDGESIGANEIVSVQSQVFVHDLDSQQCHFWEVDGKLDSFLPHGVKT